MVNRCRYVVLIKDTLRGFYTHTKCMSYNNAIAFAKKFGKNAEVVKI